MHSNPILQQYSAANEKSSTASAPLLTLQNITLPCNRVSATGEINEANCLHADPTGSFQTLLAKKPRVLHIQPKKCILKGKRQTNGKSEGKYLWRRRMRKIQSTDKIEGSSSDIVQLRTEFEIGPIGTRGKVACSLVIIQLNN